MLQYKREIMIVKFTLRLKAFKTIIIGNKTQAT